LGEVGGVGGDDCVVYSRVGVVLAASRRDHGALVKVTVDQKVPAHREESHVEEWDVQGKAEYQF
jgi:hypothetical protein